MCCTVRSVYRRILVQAHTHRATIVLWRSCLPKSGGEHEVGHPPTTSHSPSCARCFTLLHPSLYPAPYPHQLCPCKSFEANRRSLRHHFASCWPQKCCGHPLNANTHPPCPHSPFRVRLFGFFGRGLVLVLEEILCGLGAELRLRKLGWIGWGGRFGLRLRCICGLNRIVFPCFLCLSCVS